MMKTSTFNCGCGFKTNKEEEAVKHVEVTGHCMHYFGEIRPSTEKKGS